MKVAIISRSGPCFPNIISQGLQAMMKDLNIESKIFVDGIPLIMRMLPLNKRPIRWHNNLQFRIRNKLLNFKTDRKLIKELNEYQAVVISECYPNAFWKNYFAIEEFKKNFSGKVISYTEGPLDSAPVNRNRLLTSEDHNESIYDFNLFVSDVIEIKKEIDTNRQAVVGVNINHSGIKPAVKKEFIALLDFARPGYEFYREQQIKVLKKLGIRTVILEGNYPFEEIRELYKEASVFFLSFPETIGLPISECLAFGTYVFTPNVLWPMAWRLNNNTDSTDLNNLADCFKVYNNEEGLYYILNQLRTIYDYEKTPLKVFETYLLNYKIFYMGDCKALSHILNKI